MQLVINSPGTYVSQKDNCFRLKNKDRTLDVSPLKVESVVLCSQASISTQAVVQALENNIDIIFLDALGDPLGRVWFAKMGSTALIRRKQIIATENEMGFKLVAEMIMQKLENQTGFLKKLMYSRPGKEDQFTDALSQIERVIASLGNKDSDLENLRQTIMGLEGSAGRAYFKCMSQLLPEKYRFKGRSRRPAKDPFNAVLNYCYGILYSRVEKACILSGLDPYVGFLHTDNYNKKSLVFDLIEPFRIFAEQVTVYLFTGRKMKDDYFDCAEGSATLNVSGKPLVVESMHAHLDETVRYRRKNVKRKHIIQHEAHRLANILLADEDQRRPEWLEIKEF